MAGKYEGGTPGAFLEYASGARPLAMGRAFSSVAQGTGGLVWNPSGLGLPYRNEVSLNYASLYEGAALQELSFAHSGVAPVGFGLGVVRYQTPSAEERDDSNNVMGNSIYWKQAYLLGFSWTRSAAWSLGATAKMINQNIGGVSANALDADAGLMFKFRWFSLGLQRQNLIKARLKRIGGTDQLPGTTRLGVSAAIFKEFLLLSADVVGNDLGSTNLKAGLEYKLYRTLALRAGLDGSAPAMGAGFAFKDMSFDYAALSNTELGLSHRLSLRLGFGLSASEKLQARAKRLEEMKIAREERRKENQAKRLERERQKEQERVASEQRRKEAQAKRLEEARLRQERLRAKQQLHPPLATRISRSWRAQVAEEPQARMEEDKPIFVPEGRKLQVAVADFAGQGVAEVEVLAVTAFFRTALVNADVFRIVDRGNMEKILTEQKFQQTGCTTEECAVQMGKILNVERMITGEVSSLIGFYYINIRLINVQTGEIEAARSAKTKSITGLEGVTTNLVRRLVKSLKPVKEEQLKPPEPPVSLPFILPPAQSLVQESSAPSVSPVPAVQESSSPAVVPVPQEFKEEEQSAPQIAPDQKETPKPPDPVAPIPPIQPQLSPLAPDVSLTENEKASSEGPVLQEAPEPTGQQVAPDTGQTLSAEPVPQSPSAPPVQPSSKEEILPQK